MKVLFISSNPTMEAGLNLEAELTEISAVLNRGSGEQCSFYVRPGLPIESLSATVAEIEPDILHITAHGEQVSLSMSNSVGDRVALRADQLASMMAGHLPRLIYLNACDSAAIAQELAGYVDVAIGSNAPISNRAARATAAIFYQKLVTGNSVFVAATAAEATLGALAADRAKLVPNYRIGVDPRRIFLYSPPRIIAEVVNRSIAPDQKKFRIRFGLAGCPANVTQIIFYTDDMYFGSSDSADWPDNFCQVLRNGPDMRGVVWCGRSEYWTIEYDHRIVASGVTANGRAFSAISTMAEALLANLDVAANVNEDLVRAVSRTLRERV